MSSAAERAHLERLARATRVGWLFVFALIAGCGGARERDADGDGARALRIYHSPYSLVDWSTTLQLKGQHHDHIGADVARIRAYDAAGYHALAPIAYSGAPHVAGALTTRLWPIESVVAADVLASLQNVRVWFAGAEEVGFSGVHMTSPFLERYIEYWSPARGGAKETWQYENADELSALIRDNGGLPILAHPWTPNDAYAAMPRLYGVEIYSAFAEARRRQGVEEYVQIDRNAVLLENWDRALATNQELVGFAVNDHFGPIPATPISDDVRDSGKVLVLAPRADAASYRDALERGAVLAVRDMGIAKDQYPRVDDIRIDASSATIVTNGAVRWVSHGQVIHTSASLDYSRLPARATYVRAEIRGADESVVYTQAFSVRPVGDANGDYAVNAADQLVCQDVSANVDRDPDHIAACR